MEARVLHLKLLIDLATLREVNELPVVMPSLMPVVHIICVLCKGPLALG